MENLDIPKRHLLVAVDESQASVKAFQWTLDELYREGDVIHVFHVIPPGQYVVLSSDLGVEEIVEDDAATLKKAEDRAREFLTKTFAVKLEELKIPYQVEIVRFGTDTDSIGSITCKRAEQLNATALVMAKHNKGQIKEFFLGSVTSYCTHHSKVPVCVLHVD